MQVVFGGLREIMDEGIRAFDALKKVKFFLAGLAYQVVSGNDVAFTNKRFYKPGQVLSRPVQEMKVLDGKSIVECITPSLFSFFLMYVNNCLSVDDNGVFSWNTENTKYTNHGRKDACNGYTQQGIDFYWEMQAQAIVDWNKLKSVNVSKSRADIFCYETQLKLKELKCSKGKMSDVDDTECIKKVDLLLED